MILPAALGIFLSCCRCPYFLHCLKLLASDIVLVSTTTFSPYQWKNPVALTRSVVLGSKPAFKSVAPLEMMGFFFKSCIVVIFPISDFRERHFIGCAAVRRMTITEYVRYLS